MTSPRPHALVVDDEILVALTIQGFLEGCGFRVSVASNGVQALLHSELDPADLLVTDLHMPLMNGVELIRALREQRPLLPIIVVTAENKLPDEIHDFHRLSKPVSWFSLRQTLKTLLPDLAAEPAERAMLELATNS